MNPFETRIRAILAVLADPTHSRDVNDIKATLTGAGTTGVNPAVITALIALKAVPVADIDATKVLSEMTSAGVTLTSDLAQVVADALTGVTPTPVPTPALPTPTTLKSQLLKPRVIAPTLFGVLLGIVLGVNLGWGWWTVIPAVLLGLWLFKLTLDPTRTGKALVWKCVKWAAIVGIIVTLGNATKLVQQARQNADVKKAVGTDPTTPAAPDNNGTTTTKPAAPTPVDPLLQAKHARDAQATIDMLKPLAGGDPPGTKPAVDIFLARCKKVADDDFAAKRILSSDQVLFEEFKGLRDKIRYSEEDALRHLAKAKALQATIAAVPPVYGDDVPLQLSSIAAFAKAQTELLAADGAALTRLEARIASAKPPTVPPPAVDADQAAKMRALEAEEKARAAERARVQKVVTARAAVYDTLNTAEFKELVALVIKGDRKTVVRGNDERLLLAWNVHYLTTVRNPDDVRSKLEYCLQFLPTDAATLEKKGQKEVGVPAKEWAAGPIPSETLKWPYLKAYNSDATWTAYAQPSGRGAGLYTMLDLQFRGKFSEKLNKLNVDLPENERVRSLADALWVMIKAREEFWLSNEDMENLKRDPTLTKAALWSEANVASASSSTPATFMTRDQWCQRPETKR